MSRAVSLHGRTAELCEQVDERLQLEGWPATPARRARAILELEYARERVGLAADDRATVQAAIWALIPISDR